jgi:formylglycine-generating enzyme required for sulfatase activity/CheY-like chemotaxis protein
VKATGYLTAAERKADPALYPGAPAEMLEPGAPVYTPPSKPVPLNNMLNWWRWQPGASWNHPEGPGSSIEGREHHPVVQVAYEDALAYAKWIGKRLPTEAEWEFAARGGLDRKTIVWGDQDVPDGKYMANTFQGHFPDFNSAKDGFEGTSPVCSFPVNGYGLCDMSGNVWQWTSDWYRPDYYQTLTAGGAVVRNPQGPADSYDPADPGVRKRVQKGGSFLCTDQYCMRYQPGGRGKGEASIGASNVGFRLVLSPPFVYVDQRKHGIGSIGVLCQAAVAHLDKSPNAREGQKRVLDFGTHRRLSAVGLSIGFAERPVSARPLIVEEFQPELIVLDIGLPKMDGFEVIKRLRARTGGTQPIVIAVTGYGQAEDRRRTQEAGFDHHLTKPVDPKEVMAIIASVEN